MCRPRWVFLAIAFWLAIAAPAPAGLYFTDDVIPYPVPNDHKAFMIELTRLRPRPPARPDQQAAGQPQPSTDRRQQAVDRLETREKEGLLTLDDRINLSGYYVLIGQYEKARDLLLPLVNPALVNPGRDDFRVHSNLATAYHRLSDFEKAIQHVEIALKLWPKLHPGWTVKQLAWYRRIEEYYLTLLNTRNVEVHRRLPQDTIDEIFPDVRFAERRGDYLIGGVRDAVRMRLPPDALDIVRQLLFWNPTDQRLFWLYGELLNADGDTESAFSVLDGPVFSTGLNYPLLREHRTAHVRFREFLPPATRYRLLHFGNMSPLGLAASEKGLAVMLREVRDTTDPAQPETEPAGTPTSWLPDWRPLLVGFGAGIIVGMIVVFQVRQLRRGRTKQGGDQRRPPVSSSAHPAS